jgi:aconitate hydratase
VELGLTVKPAIRTSLAPGSRAWSPKYLTKAGLLPYLRSSVYPPATAAPPASQRGPLAQPVELVVKNSWSAPRFSGNRNSKSASTGIQATITSPPLVVAYAIADQC